MAGVFGYGEVSYDVDDTRVALWNGDGTYGTPVDLNGINEFRIEFVMKSQDGNGDGGLILTASSIISANITIRNFGIPSSAVPILFGGSNDEYAPGVDAYTILDIPVGAPMPYFGALVRAFDPESATGTGGSIFFVPKIRVVANFQWDISYNNFRQPELTGRALQDGNLQSNVSGRSRFVREKRYKRNMPLLSAVSWPLGLGL